MKIAISTSGRGFTLVELLVTITVISLLVGISLPSMMALFDAGADKQACNIMAAQLMNARAEAIRNMTYAGVHVQLADHNAPGNSALENVCFTAVVWDDPDTPEDNMLTLMPGCSPQRMPRHIALGRIDSAYVTPGGDYKGLGGDGLKGFTTFTVLFSSNGKVATQVAGQNLRFAPTDLLFTGAGKLWDYGTAGGNTGLPGATALTIFNIEKFVFASDASDRAEYLDINGMFLPINLHTGRLLPRK